MNKFLLLSYLALLISGCKPTNEHHYQGYVEGENIYLASPNPGILENLAVQRGQKVTKNQLLFILDPNPQRLIIKQLEGDLEQAKAILQDLKNPRRTPEIAAIAAQIEQVNAQLELTAIRVDRIKKLYLKQDASKDAYDEAVSVYEQQQKLKAQYEANLALAKKGSREEQINAQEAQIDAINARLAEAQWQLQQKKVFAPDAGLIFDTYYRVGEYVGSQQAVLSLLTPPNVHIEFFIPNSELENIYIGKKITVLCYSCTKAEEALITYIAPEAEYMPPLVYSRENQDKLVFRIQASHINVQQFKPGEPVEVIIHD